MVLATGLVAMVPGGCFLADGTTVLEGGTVSVDAARLDPAGAVTGAGDFAAVAVAGGAEPVAGDGETEVAFAGAVAVKDSAGFVAVFGADEGRGATGGGTVSGVDGTGALTGLEVETEPVEAVAGTFVTGSGACGLAATTGVFGLLAAATVAGADGVTGGRAAVEPAGELATGGDVPTGTSGDGTTGAT